MKWNRDGDQYVGNGHKGKYYITEWRSMYGSNYMICLRLEGSITRSAIGEFRELHTAKDQAEQYDIGGIA